MVTYLKSIKINSATKFQVSPTDAEKCNKRLFGKDTFITIHKDETRPFDLNIYDVLLAAMYADRKEGLFDWGNSTYFKIERNANKQSLLADKDVSAIAANVLLNASDDQEFPAGYYKFPNENIDYSVIRKMDLEAGVKPQEIKNEPTETKMSRSQDYVVSEGEDYDAYAWGDEEDVGLGHLLVNGNSALSYPGKK